MAVARSMQEREFILSCDKELPLDQQTIFLIRPLSSKEQIAISDLVSKADGMTAEIVIEKDGEKRTHRSPVPANFSERSDDTVMRCLVGWKNYKDEDGKELDFKAMEPSVWINRLFPEWREEIATFADSLNYPSEAELKNSSSRRSGRSLKSAKS